MIVISGVPTIIMNLWENEDLLEICRSTRSSRFWSDIILFTALRVKIMGVRSSKILQRITYNGVIPGNLERVNQKWPLSASELLFQTISTRIQQCEPAFIRRENGVSSRPTRRECLLMLPVKWRVDESTDKTVARLYTDLIVLYNETVELIRFRDVVRNKKRATHAIRWSMKNLHKVALWHSRRSFTGVTL